jgi:hypothetical protein
MVVFVVGANVLFDGNLYRFTVDQLGLVFKDKVVVAPMDGSIDD